MTIARPSSRTLIIKTSSLGDVVHTLAAVTDAARALPGIRFDWVVEESLAPLARLHPAVETVIPVAIRRWRQAPLRTLMRGEYARFRRALRKSRYEAIVDAQGLFKSALIARQARGVRYGPGWDSAREPLASLAYDHRLRVSKRHHAVTGLRKLFSDALGYPMPTGVPDFGISHQVRPRAHPGPQFVLFLHGTHWQSKAWPQVHWVALAQHLNKAGLQVWLPQASNAEYQRACAIADECPNVRVLPRLDLSQLAPLIASAAGLVGVDTGLSHLAAALGVPVVVLYGASSADLTGALGPHCTNLPAHFPCSPCKQRVCGYRQPSEVTPACFASLPPEVVAQALELRMRQARRNDGAEALVEPPTAG